MGDFSSTILKPQVSASNPPSTPTNSDWIIHEVFQKYDIHLFAGPSGGGKTSLLAQMLEVWARGGKWFGHQCYPCPFVYLACERTARNVRRTFARMGWTPPIIIGSTDFPPTGLTPELAINRALTKEPDARFLVIEGLTRLVPKGKLGDPTVISDLLVGIQKICERRELTVILVTWSPKQSARDRYENPRQRAMGSVAFAGCTSTIVLIEPESDGAARSVMILRQNFPDEKFYMAFSERGVLQQIDSPTTQQQDLKEYILSLDNDFRFSFDDLIAAFSQTPERTIYRLLSVLVREHEVIRTCRGRYRRSRSNTRSLLGNSSETILQITDSIDEAL